MGEHEAGGREKRRARENFGFYSLQDEKPLGGGKQRSNTIQCSRSQREFALPHLFSASERKCPRVLCWRAEQTFSQVVTTLT